MRFGNSASNKKDLLAGFSFACKPWKILDLNFSVAKAYQNLITLPKRN
jgi:hypothetical protein